MLTSPNWRSAISRRLVVPSWAASVVVHAGLWFFILYLSQLSSCRSDIAGDDGDSFRNVGIQLRPAAEAVAEQLIDNPETGPPAESGALESLIAELPPVVSANLPKPTPAPPVIGTGSLTLPNVDLIAPPGQVSPRQGVVAGGPAGGGGTTFMGIEDVGKKFVYVIDRSASMSVDNALQAAKNELLASIEQLTTAQEFLIIFYSSDTLVISPRSPDQKMFRGTPEQRLQVSNRLAEFQATGGTDHLPAILKALEYNPDVIFLLTDGTDAERLNSVDLRKIQSQNRSGARIHSIQFGRDPETPATTIGNFLKDLSQQNHGKFAYRRIGP